ncbi:STAS domain-containing protein [Marinobacter hydrocarbonoclasticus]|uniref:STAS domain-containing protein n=1 Tax=Marinobacter nauticus TaxID=2743 RepID=UPI001A8F437C|nr:STAS domain-containing protein [Marinobacter nauticus]MBN8238334.1 STAS domain-containing protein [Marinobacter nauticus]
MSNAQELDAETGCLSIRGELTIYVANAAFESLSRAFTSGNLSRVDLSGVTELDTSGLQIVLMARTLRAASGEPVSLVDQSDAVRECLELAGLETTP